MLNFIKKILYRIDMLEGRASAMEQHLGIYDPTQMFRRDTLENWVTYNPVIKNKEICLITDKPDIYKRGDGKSKFMDLPTKHKIE